MNDAQSLPQCPRCESVELSVLPQQAADVSFLVCPSCERQYQLRNRSLLTERWMGPLSLLLYPIALTFEPLKEIERVVKHLVEAEGWPADQLLQAAAEAELELQQPTQQVSKILDLISEASEDDVRTYLRLVSERLRQELQE